MENFVNVAEKIAPWAILDKIEDHDSKWHQFGVLGHSMKVSKNAEKILNETGIDIVQSATWHDIGKFIARKENDKGGFSFHGHEEASAVYLEEIGGFSEEEIFLVRNHGVIRGKTTVEEIISLCGNDKNLVRKLIMICAADTSGKGFTPDQKIQREEFLAPKFFDLCNESGNTDIAEYVKDIILTW